MTRKIIVLSDGTGNSAGKLFRTNVWRTYQALDVTNSRQVAFYDDGVGTSSFKPLAILGGVFGWGLKRNVIGLYVFLCRNYKEGDEIYAFGFSRGAFTIRVLLRFVLSQGLVSKFHSTDDLERKARRLYRRFRSEEAKRQGLALLTRPLRKLANLFARKDVGEPEPLSKIKFLGLWDTVDAYGIPIEELKSGLDKLIWPLSLQDRVLDPRIQKACHALSLDDARSTFHPVLWDETDEKLEVTTDNERLTQVWFAGAHANVGGGYPDDGLSNVPLSWMLDEASKHGLLLRSGVAAEIKSNVAPLGKIYNSRSGLGAYYRYGPRRLQPLEDRYNSVVPCPKVHETVLWRLWLGTDSYSPLNLPSNLRVVSNTSVDGKNIFRFAEYVEKMSQDATGFAGRAAVGGQLSRTSDYLPAIRSPDQSDVDLVWNTAWWRRVAFYLTLTATLIFVFLPVLHPAFVPDYHTSGRYLNFLRPFFFLEADYGWLQKIIYPPAEVLVPVVQQISNFAFDLLPSVLRPWAKFYHEHVGATLLAAGATLLLFAWGKHLDRRIQDRALAGWNSNWRALRKSWWNISVRWRLVANFVVAVLAVWIILVSMDQHSYLGRVILSINSQDRADKAEIISGLQNYRYAYVAAILFAFAMIAGVATSLYQIFKQVPKGDTLPETRSCALLFANRLSNSPRLFGIASLFVKSGVFLIFLVASVVAVVSLANKFAFEVLRTAGMVCDTRISSEEMAKRNYVNNRSVNVSIDNPCQRTGIRLEPGIRYKVEIDRYASDFYWKSRGVTLSRRQNYGYQLHLDQLPGSILRLPFMRSWGDPWLTPIVQQGDKFYALPWRGSEIIGDGAVYELVFFVNEVVIGWPEIWKSFYKQNSASLTLKVRRLDPPEGFEW